MSGRGGPRGPRFGRISMPSAPPAASPVPDLDDKCVMQLGDEPVEVHARHLVKVQELGRGAYGVVDKMSLPERQFELAVKRIHVSVDSEEYKRMLVELRTSAKSAECAFMVRCYGAMHREGDVWICMEVMDKSLDQLYRLCVDKGIPLPERFLARVAFAVRASPVAVGADASQVTMALNFMKESMELIHRDVKPSNILVNRCGQIKICDYGISGHLTNSVAKTIQAGCKPYMPVSLRGVRSKPRTPPLQPERIEGDNRDSYDVRSDVWSLGITMVEVATGNHPYGRWKTPFEQLKQVVNEAAPTLPDDGRFSPEFRHFVGQCLLKNFKLRPKYPELLRDDFVKLGEAVTEGEVGQLVGQVLSVLDTYTQPDLQGWVIVGSQ